MQGDPNESFLSRLERAESPMDEADIVLTELERSVNETGDLLVILAQLVREHPQLRPFIRARLQQIRLLEED